MNEVYLLTGGNMGDRMNYLNRAGQLLEKHTGRIRACSSVYETAAWGRQDQDPFLNQVLHLETNLQPHELMARILQIEEELGRKRSLKYGPREIDIDILLYNDQIIEEPTLTIPHPQMPFRRFVLQPLAELAPDEIHPQLGKTILQMLADCTDPLAVNKIT